MIKNIHLVTFLGLLVVCGQSLAGGALRLKVEDINGDADTDIFKSGRVTITATYKDAQANAKNPDGSTKLDSGDQNVTGWKSWEGPDEPGNFSNSSSYSRSYLVNGSDHEKGDSVKVSFRAEVSGEKQPAKKSETITIIVGDIKLSVSEEIVEADDQSPSPPTVTLRATLDVPPDQDLQYTFYAGNQEIYTSDMTRTTSYALDLTDKVKLGGENKIYGKSAAAVRFRVETSRSNDYPLPAGSGDGGGPLDDTHPPVANEADVIWAALSISGVPEETVVGLKNTLSSTVLPAGIVPEYSWSIGGETIGDYVITPDQSSATVEPYDNTSGASTEFYWVNSGQHEIELRVEYKGVALIEKTNANVVKPDVDAFFKPNDLTKVYTEETHIEKALGITPNMKFQYQNFDDKGFAGKLEWLQIISTSGITRYTNRPVAPHSHSGELDNAFPYPFTDPLTGFAEDGPTTSERPPSEVTRIERYDSFVMYLMYTPNGGIPVPLKSGVWSWGGIAGFNEHGIWKLLTPENEVAPTSQTSMDPEANHPTWSKKFTNLIQN